MGQGLKFGPVIKIWPYILCERVAYEGSSEITRMRVGMSMRYNQNIASWIIYLTSLLGSATDLGKCRSGSRDRERSIYRYMYTFLLYGNNFELVFFELPTKHVSK